jgi:hypothetical protein
MQPQPHQRPLKPVKEFLTVQPIVDQPLSVKEKAFLLAIMYYHFRDDRRRSSPHVNYWKTNF